MLAAQGTNLLFGGRTGGSAAFDFATLLSIDQINEVDGQVTVIIVNESSLLVLIVSTLANGQSIPVGFLPTGRKLPGCDNFSI